MNLTPGPIVHSYAKTVANSHCFQGDVRMTIYFLVVGLTALFGYIIIIWTEYHVFRTLRSVRHSMSSTTRRMHAEFKRVLTALAITPLIFSLAPITYFLMTSVLYLNSGVSSGFVTIAATSMAFVNPLVTVVSVGPYRRFLLRLLLSWNRVQSITTVNKVPP